MNQNFEADIEPGSAASMALSGLDDHSANRLTRRFYKWFNLSSVIILSVSGIAKLWASSGGSQYLTVTDPIIGVSFRHLLILAGLVEVSVATLCFLKRRSILPAVLVACISTNFLVYRIGLWWMGWMRPCHCFGNLTDALNISPQVADNAMKILLAYLVVGSYVMLFCFWRNKQRVFGQNALI